MESTIYNSLQKERAESIHKLSIIVIKHQIIVIIWDNKIDKLSRLLLK